MKLALAALAALMALAGLGTIGTSAMFTITERTGDVRFRIDSLRRHLEVVPGSSVRAGGSTAVASGDVQSARVDLGTAPAGESYASVLVVRNVRTEPVTAVLETPGLPPQVASAGFLRNGARVGSVTLAPGETATIAMVTSSTVGRGAGNVALRTGRGPFPVETYPVQAEVAAPAPPAPPPSVSVDARPPADAQEVGAVELAWTASPSPGVTAYRVYRDGVRLAETSGTAFRDTSAPRDERVTYTVRAVRTGLESSDSQAVSVTAIARPAAPLGVTAKAVAPTAEQDVGAILVSWAASASAGVTGYVVLRAPAGGAFETITSRPVTETGFSDATAVQGVTYRYIVRALRESVPSRDETASAPVDPIARPPAPASVTASAEDPVGEATTGLIRVSWTAPLISATTRYLIFRSVDGGEYVQRGDTDLTTFVDADVVGGREYRYRVRTVRDGISSRAATESAAVRARVRPGRPGNLTAVAGAGGVIRLSWNEPVTVAGAPVSSYRVLRGSSASGPFVQVGTSTDRSFADTPPAQELYHYVVRAYSGTAAAEGLTSTSASATSDATAPDAPASVSLTGGGTYINLANFTNVSVTVQVAAGSGNRATDVVSVTLTQGARSITRTGSSPGGAGGAVTITGFDTTGFSDGPVSVTARIADEAGNQSRTASSTATRDTAAPAPATSVTFSDRGGRDRLNGSCETGATVRVRRVSPPSSAVYTEFCPFSGLLVDDNSLLTNVTYQVVVVDPAGNPSPPTEHQFLNVV